VLWLEYGQEVCAWGQLAGLFAFGRAVSVEATEVPPLAAGIFGVSASRRPQPSQGNRRLSDRNWEGTFVRLIIDVLVAGQWPRAKPMGIKEVSGGWD
jgi:hypothetical protein